MLAEGFLRMLRYREERKLLSTAKMKRSQAHTHCVDPFSHNVSNSNSADLQTDSEAGPDQDNQDPITFQGLKALPQGTEGLSIPGCSPALTLYPDFTVCLDNCSLLEQYPDLELVNSHNTVKTTLVQNAFVSDISYQQEWAAQKETISPMTDQGYLVIPSSEPTSLDMPGSGLEPMSNSVLNGLLDKQLEEVYMQHLTDNLARCNSHLGNSLLHGLVPPPQPSSQLRGPDSLEASLEVSSGGDNSKKICYLSTQNLTACTTNFSSPVLRISEADCAPLH